MKWRAKSSLCRQPFNFLSCMRKIRHAIRKELVRQMCVSFAGIKIAKTTCEQLSSSFCFVFLLCPSGFKYFSRKISWDRLLRKHYATNCSKSCLIFNSKRQFFFSRLIGIGNTLMLKKFLSQHIMISWLELNHLNAFVKIATDALMPYIKRWNNVLKRFMERWFTPINDYFTGAFLGSSHFKTR